MHKSRLAGLTIDCNTDDLESAATFWSKALGGQMKISPDPEDSNYIEIVTEANEPHIEVQKVNHDSRVHLDIESDDIEAEVQRLEALGAKRIAAVHTWVVLEAPTGQRFCVVRPQRSGFEDEARVWRRA
jgi:predicted enzyme related to lactoylglutathione lyase